MRKLSVYLIIAASTMTLSGCGLVTDGVNYTDLTTPRYCSLDNTKTFQAQDTLKVVSYNIKYAVKSELAGKLLHEDKNLADADIIFLQEMDREGVEKIANTIGCNYIYYPAVRHPLSNRDFGNAIVTKWPIIFDQKIILPHLDPDNLQRVVVGAGIQVGDKYLMAYSIHMSIWLKPEERRDQLMTLISSIPARFDHVIIGGDFNTYTKFNRRTVFQTFNEAGFNVATTSVKWTYKQWFLLNKKSLIDYIFVKNMQGVEAGIVKNRRASDHVPVWTRVKFDELNSAKE